MYGPPFTISRRQDQGTNQYDGRKASMHCNAANQKEFCVEGGYTYLPASTHSIYSTIDTHRHTNTDGYSLDGQTETPISSRHFSPPHSPPRLNQSMATTYPPT
mmetsp:Transcript_41860/g.118720  ORF Transcript_41860/g.118720 Transcript_41860/m.118720 type:complete len:103 (-) Transcript_41860:545-853(-)